MESGALIEFVQNNYQIVVPVAIGLIALGWGWISPIFPHEKFKVINQYSRILQDESADKFLERKPNGTRKLKKFVLNATRLAGVHLYFHNR